VGNIGTAKLLAIGAIIAAIAAVITQIETIHDARGASTSVLVAHLTSVAHRLQFRPAERMTGEAIFAKASRPLFA
jgi:hypothetical protein